MSIPSRVNVHTLIRRASPEGKHLDCVLKVLASVCLRGIAVGDDGHFERNYARKEG